VWNLTSQWFGHVEIPLLETATLQGSQPVTDMTVAALSAVPLDEKTQRYPQTWDIPTGLRTPYLIYAFRMCGGGALHTWHAARRRLQSFGGEDQCHLYVWPALWLFRCVTGPLLIKLWSMLCTQSN
jgi:hypothetical protein